MASLALHMPPSVARPPAKGSFPLDRDRECTHVEQQYLACLRRREKRQAQQLRLSCYDPAASEARIAATQDDRQQTEATAPDKRRATAASSGEATAAPGEPAAAAAQAAAAGQGSGDTTAAHRAAEDAAVAAAATPWDHLPCRPLAQLYLQCRMERNLMARENLANLGFRTSQTAAEAAPQVSPSPPVRSSAVDSRRNGNSGTSLGRSSSSNRNSRSNLADASSNHGSSSPNSEHGSNLTELQHTKRSNFVEEEDERRGGSRGNHFVFSAGPSGAPGDGAAAAAAARYANGDAAAPAARSAPAAAHVGKGATRVAQAHEEETPRRQRSVLTFCSFFRNSPQHFLPVDQQRGAAAAIAATSAFQQAATAAHPRWKGEEEEPGRAAARPAGATARANAQQVAAAVMPPQTPATFHAANAGRAAPTELRDQQGRETRRERGSAAGELEQRSPQRGAKLPFSSYLQEEAQQHSQRQQSVLLQQRQERPQSDQPQEEQQHHAPEPQQAHHQHQEFQQQKRDPQEKQGGEDTRAATKKKVLRKEDTGYVAGISALRPYAERGFFGRAMARYDWTRGWIKTYFGRKSVLSSFWSSETSETPKKEQQP